MNEHVTNRHRLGRRLRAGLGASVLAGAVILAAACPGPEASAAAVPAGAASPARIIPPIIPPLAGPLRGKVIGVDPGHNGGNSTHLAEIDRKIWNGREWETCNTTGTETDGGYTEALFNFEVATDLRADLIADGAKVVMTRTTNTGVGPCVNKRAAIISDAHANVGIAIHADGAPASGRGFALLVPVADGPNDKVIGSSLAFAKDVRSAMLAGTPMPISNYDGVDAIQPRDDLGGLNLVTVPMIFIEVGNMRNATDARLLTSPAFQREVARALTAAIVKFAR